MNAQTSFIFHFLILLSSHLAAVAVDDDFDDIFSLVFAQFVTQRSAARVVHDKLG